MNQEFFFFMSPFEDLYIYLVLKNNNKMELFENYALEKYHASTTIFNQAEILNS